MHEGRRRVVIVEDDSKANRGWANLFGSLFVIVMGIALIDHAVTSALSTVVAWLNQH